jgi:hypothetical protein
MSRERVIHAHIGIPFELLESWEDAIYVATLSVHDRGFTRYNAGNKAC